MLAGASDGIGAAIAKTFATHNVSLGIAGRDKAKLKSVGRECINLGAKQVVIIFNYTEYCKF